MNLKSQLIKILAEQKENYVSGSYIAEQANVSRNAVWKTVKTLESEGFKIESNAKGYRISQNNNKLNDWIIKSFLHTSYIGKNMVVLDSVDSTNNYAKELASQGAENGTAVIADCQTAGKGRLGRSFVSPKGTGIYMSIVIRPDFDISLASMITSAVACGVAEAIEVLCGHTVNIKWVNDLYMNGKKMCGILTEASFGLEMKTLDYAVIGIGINVRNSDFGEELNKTVTSIENESGKIIDRNQLCGNVLNMLEKYLAMLNDKSYIDYYRKREILTGNTITAVVGREEITGTAVGIDDNLNLVVVMQDGTERHLSSGEANLCRIKQ